VSTQWVVTNASSRITLDAQKQGETTFTVSNPAMNADRAVFEVVPGDGADRAWFTVTDPQRMVPGTGSVPYLVKVAVPAQAPAGSYSVQGRVYSADSAPEESSVLSGRVLLDVGAAPAPVEPKPKPWWLVAVAALVVLVIGVVTWLLVAGGDEPAPIAGGGTPSTSASASAPPREAKVPNLLGLTEDQATKELAATGLAVGTVKRKHDPANKDKVLSQGTAATTVVPGGTKVDLVVAVSLAAPGIASPGAGASFSRDSTVVVKWNQTEPWVAKWRVVTYKRTCYFYFGHENRDCRWDAESTVDPTAKEYGAKWSMSFQPLLNLGWYQTGPVLVHVSAWDDFGQVGPAAAVEFRLT
jgi:hypothetical protein